MAKIKTKTTNAQEIVTSDPMLPTVEIAAREEREQTLKRFNGLFVYAPVLLMLLLLLLFMGGIIIAAVFNGDALQQTYSSGFADIIVLMACLIPATLAAAILPAASLFLLYKRRQHGSFVRAPLTKGLRKVDGIIVTADDKAAAAQQQVADRIVDARGRVAYASTVFVRMQEFIVEKIDQLIKRN